MTVVVLESDRVVKSFNSARSKWYAVICLEVGGSCGYGAGIVLSLPRLQL